MDKETALLRGLREQFEVLSIESEALRRDITRVEVSKANTLIPDKFDELLAGLFSRVEAISEEYNSAIIEFKDFIKRCNLQGSTSLGVLPQPRSCPNLDKIKIGSRKVMKMLDFWIIPLSADFINRLDGIKTEIKSTMENAVIQENLNLAVQEIEHAHFLSSCLITSRVIDNLLSSIPVGDTSGDDLISKRIQHLVEKGVISSKELDVKTSIIKASKKARDFLSHHIDKFPTSADAFSLLGDCMNIVKVINKLNTPS